MKFDDVRTVHFWPPFVPQAHPPYARIYLAMLSCCVGGGGGGVCGGRGEGDVGQLTFAKKFLLKCPSPK